MSAEYTEHVYQEYHYKDYEPIHQREEIVRCRDCKRFTSKGTHKFENGKVNADYCDYVRGWMLQITPDGYCAWGERKTNDKTGDLVTHGSGAKAVEQ